MEIEVRLERKNDTEGIGEEDKKVSNDTIRRVNHKAWHLKHL